MTSTGAEQRPELDSPSEGERETYVGRRARETRQIVLDAALEEFRERGYNAATVDSIAGRAGVSRGTIYTYFQSKRAMLIVLGGANNEWFQTLVERFAAVDKSRPNPSLSKWIRDYMDFMDQDQSFALAFNEAALSDEPLRKAGTAQYVRAWRRVGEALVSGQPRKRPEDPKATEPGTDEDNVALGLMLLGSFERAWFFYRKLRVPVTREQLERQMERMILQLAGAGGPEPA
jgi:AcrR family transcriptional regulator